MLAAYRKRWDRIHAVPLAIEQDFSAPLHGKNLVGRIDLLLKVNNEILVVDHKTASSASSHDDQGTLGWQAGFYLLAYPQAKAFVASVLVKPRSKPKSNESIENYAERVEIGFRDVRIERDDARLEAFETSLGRVIDAMDHTVKHGPWGNPGACVAYGRPCEWSEVCQGKMGLDDPSITTRETSLKNVSPSRLSCFSQCSLKHHLRYVRKLERKESVEALEFGSAVHEELAAYWAERMHENGLKSDLVQHTIRPVEVDF